MSLAARVRVERGEFRLTVDLDAEDGEVVAVLGPNGAGKSTLLRALAGLHRLTSGEVRLGDRVLDAPAGRAWVPPAQRGIGVVFQDYRLFPHLSARENVAFGPRSTGTPRGGARAAADAWLRRLGLDGLGGRRPGQLSGGQAQRVALARALATDPRLLLLDEPLAALDGTTRGEVRRVLRTQLADFAGPALLVTHELLDALTLADRVLVLQDGRVVQDSAPRELTRRPLTPYVARLVGLNLYAGTAVDGRLVLKGGGEIPLPGGAPTGRVLAAVPPSAVRIGRAGSPAVVAHLEELVDRVRIHLDGSPGGFADLDLANAAGGLPQPGTGVRLRFDPAGICVYRDPAGD